ncbi:MAG: molybdenum cofactor biosynthesis protein MoaE [Dehalococcoidia bacterium]|nr:molybdenum cofactor biosynthesis protein MoaE [Dehalococcoidia bacterium]
MVLTRDVLDADTLTSAVQKPENGGVVTFLGVTRNHNEGRKVLYLEYEAYEEMAQQELQRVAEEASRRWPGIDIAIGHRLGRLEIGEVSLIIATGAPHRKEAFAACAFAVDHIKETVPIWKREVFAGGQVWIGSEEHAEAQSPAT